MGRILIGDPTPEIRALLGLVAERLGHEASFADDAASADVEVDAALIEPADGALLELAVALRSRRPELPIVFVSIAPPSAETRALYPIRHLLKPFVISELGSAIEAAFVPVP